jgi:hypothetical protein
MIDSILRKILFKQVIEEKNKYLLEKKNINVAGIFTFGDRILKLLFGHQK